MNITTESGPVKKGFLPDYRLDVGEVYRRFVLWDIEKIHSLSTLSLIFDKSNGIYKLPSWVPDFSHIKQQNFLPDYYFTFNATPWTRPTVASSICANESRAAVSRKTYLRFLAVQGREKERERRKCVDGIGWGFGRGRTSLGFGTSLAFWHIRKRVVLYSFLAHERKMKNEKV